ncbi:MAG: hypothetical protein Q8K90_07940 [Brevundimonas sp.]|nr:hypothetical protein [Brevundimonas sp.]
MTLSSTRRWFALVALAIGGVILLWLFLGLLAMTLFAIGNGSLTGWIIVLLLAMIAACAVLAAGAALKSELGRATAFLVSAYACVILSVLVGATIK